MGNIISFLTIKGIPIPKDPTFHPSNVTVLVPTTAGSCCELLRTLTSLVACGPFEVIVVTATRKVSDVRASCEKLMLEYPGKLRVLGVDILHKRRQMIAGLLTVRTELSVFADDDVLWPPRYLEYLIAAFDDMDVGACGTRQRVRRSDQPGIWHFLGTSYLERRNFNTGATSNIDGGISTLSGRTYAVRTSIVQEKQFYNAFLTDAWFGRLLNTDDDKCMTRWLYAHGWKIKLQFHEDAVLETTLETGPKFLYQCLRWSRAHWRGNLTVMMNHSYWWRYFSQLNTRVRER